MARIFQLLARAQEEGQGVQDVLDQYTIFYTYLIVAALVTWFVSTAGFNFTGAKVARNIRVIFFAAVLKQNMAIFDSLGAGPIVSQLTADTDGIQDAISSKLSQTIAALGTFIGMIAVCFALDWVLTLQIIWSLVLGYVVLYIGGKVMVRYSS